MRCLTLLTLAAACLVTTANAADQPNVLWITSEDNGPQLGCYGDEYATTPNLDSIADKGTIYLNAWSTAPVCAPARTTIISGVYPPATGSQHMRSSAPLPPMMKMYPQYLREAGYYCTNNSKEDYNLIKPDGVWDESSRKAHFRNRKAGQPFFAIFNFTVCHESQVRKRPHQAVHDPAKVRVPEYHPDTPEVRQDWAQYYDKITEMDGMAGNILKQLEEDGLTDDTIVFYYGDHGAGMPRGKRWPYSSGLRVPMIVSIPPKWKHLASPDYKKGGSSDRLVGFIDLAPTLLSLVGIAPPEYMQGHAFQGKYCQPKPKYAFGFRGRMDERYDMVRTVGDGRYIYLKHYMPHKIYGQYIDYMFKTPTTAVWKQLYDEGKLEPPKTFFWETKPAEELFDLQNDPDEVNNLVDSPKHQDILARMRKAHKDWVFRVRDIGFLPEGQMHTRDPNVTPYEMGQDPSKYPLEKIFAAAQAATSLKPDDIPKLLGAIQDDDSAVRYWAAMGLLMREADGVNAGRDALNKALSDDAPYVRIAAAEALGRYGSDAEAAKALDVLMPLANVEDSSAYLAMAALNAIDYMDDRAKSAEAAIEALPIQAKGMPPRVGSGYLKNLKGKILSDLKGE
jgi:arylsulfatase A-like enzyme